MTAISPDRVASTTPFQRGIREALYAGAIAFGLFFLLIGIKTDQNIRNELILVTRWGLLAVVIGLVMAGRFLTVAYLQPYLEARKAAEAKAPVVAPSTEKTFFWKHWTKIAIGALILYPVVIVLLVGFQGSLKWVDNFGIQILIYVMLAWGLNIVVGLAGLLDLGYVAFYAVGAYCYALLGTEFGWSFWFLLPAAGAMAAFWGVILGFPVLRLRGDYLAIVTLAFGEIIRLVLINWREVTNGTAGVSGIPKVTFFGFFDFDVSSPYYISKVFDIAQSGAYYKIFLYYLALALALLTAFVTIRLRRLPVGRAWEALREDEIACRSLGINTTNTKLTAFAIGAMFGGFAGSFFATRQGFISPESFTFLESAIILAIVVLGGLGSQIGVVIASVVMIGGIEMLRNIGFLGNIFGPGFDPVQYRMLIFGLAMVGIMVWKPRGLVTTRDPSAVLKEKKKIGADLVAQGEGH